MTFRTVLTITILGCLTGCNIGDETSFEKAEYGETIDFSESEPRPDTETKPRPDTDGDPGENEILPQLSIVCPNEIRAGKWLNGQQSFLLGNGIEVGPDFIAPSHEVDRHAVYDLGQSRWALTCFSKELKVRIVVIAEECVSKGDLDFLCTNAVQVKGTKAKRPEELLVHF